MVGGGRGGGFANVELFLLGTESRFKGGMEPGFEGLPEFGDEEFLLFGADPPSEGGIGPGFEGFPELATLRGDLARPPQYSSLLPGHG